MRQFASQVSAKSFDGLLVIEPEGTLDLHRPTARARPAGRPDRRPRPRSPQFPSVATTNRAGGACRRPAPAGARPPPAAGDHRRRTVRLHPRTPGRLPRHLRRGRHRARPDDSCSKATSPSTADAAASSRRSSRRLEFDADLRPQRPVRRRRHAGRPGDRPERAERRVGGRLRRHPVRRAHRAAADHGASADAPDGRGGGPDADGATSTARRCPTSPKCCRRR